MKNEDQDEYGNAVFWIIIGVISLALCLGYLFLTN